MIEWQKLELNIDELKTNERNPRMIDGDNLERLKERIKDYGFYSVLVVDDTNTILSGNQRYQALKELGYKTIQVLKPNRKLTKDEKDKIMLSCNSHEGDWDISMLSELDFDPAILTEFNLDHLVIKFDKDLEELGYQDFEEQLGAEANEFFIRFPFRYEDKEFIDGVLKKYSKKDLATKFVGMIRNL